ncbi:hypothetical protein DK419_24265 [Methylobacterium terrae]|uniref:DUF6531 domain-containing protein n=1 Tax=Methylobacterium terrae TaxID=2202827 RepID=A0A2U8WUJ7_9HYPH|nr:DUF6531 domain-containing protein [Methylobacterium terrae]AWN49091.1 hypothetical protein DK419_24265 [Methylobacterium terrae]
MPEEPKDPKNQKGRADCPCEVSNPVRIDTGASVSHDVEFTIRGTLDLVLSRHYASDETFLGPLGRGVASPLDVVLTETPDGDLVYRESVHRRISFERPAPLPRFFVYNDAYKHLALAFDDLDALVVKDRGLFRRFARCPDEAWRLMRIEDRNGTAIVVTRDAQGLIIRIDHPDGLALAFANDPQGRRIRVELVGTDGSACEILRYAYDARGNLAAAQATHGPSHTYEHDDWDRRVAWTDVVTTWSRRIYDAESRVVRIATRDAGRSADASRRAGAAHRDRRPRTCGSPSAGRSGRRRKSAATRRACASRSPARPGRGCRRCAARRNPPPPPPGRRRRGSGGRCARSGW